MRRMSSVTAMVLVCAFLAAPVTVRSEGSGMFSSRDQKEKFAADISAMVTGAWRTWQGSVVVNNVDVEGPNGIILPGDLGGPYLTASSMMGHFDRSGRSREYIECVRAVSGALENGMRSWQRGYMNRDVVFPQGASCTFTLTPCTNVPVKLSSGVSYGAPMMEEEELFNYMLYRAPAEDETVTNVLKACAKGISSAFTEWTASVSIVDILASGGIAPQPAPMGTGPGPVRNARGHGGRLAGPVIDSRIIYRAITEK